MLLYHSTNAPEVILREGFRNGAGIGPGRLENAVWFTDVPAPHGGMTLCVNVPDSLAAAGEVVGEEGALGYREFLLTAEVVNQFPIRLIDEG